MQKLLGQVKAIRLERADFSGESGQSIEGARRLLEARAFDTEGREIEMTLYSYAQPPTSVESTAHPSTAVKYRSVKTYNEKGDISESTLHNHDGSIASKTSYSYDGNGNPLTRLQYDASNELAEKGVYSYDPAGSLWELSLYSADGNLVGKISFDPAGGIDKPLRSTRFNPDGSVQRASGCVYDSSGNLIEKSYHKEGGSLDHKISYRYDSEGNLIEHSWYEADGSLFRRHLVTYDGKGNLTEETIRDVKRNVEETYTYAYEFDSHGNWIKKTVLKVQTEDQSSFHTPVYVIYRTLAYW
jgi:antitoxin component YwqK of YwqJK toxin-antitoxin module